MKKSIIFLIAVMLTLNMLSAQGRKAMPSMPDMKRLMAMTPAQQKLYADSFKNALGQQVAQMADEAGIAVDETILSGFDIQPPVKDIARLNLIPSRPPTRIALVEQVQKSKAQLESLIPKPQLVAIEKFSAQNSPEKIHQASIAGFYNNEPEKALLLLMNVATKQSDSMIVWNNLGAMYNQVGMQHRAVPMLTYCLQNEPGSSMVLNNLGQSYMGLGDLAYAKHYFAECLLIDSLNPDANHSMGLLYMFEKNFDAAMDCFNRELTVAVRSSTLAYAAKMGKKVDLRKLMKKKNALNGRPQQKDFFEEINLGKFKIPTYPGTVQEAYTQVPEYKEMSTSIGAEIMFWQKAMITASQSAADGNSYHGVYNSLVKVLLDELHEEFTPGYLRNYTDGDAETGKEMYATNAALLAKVVCPKPPAGSSLTAQEAMEIQCCIDKKQPLVNKRISEYGSFWRPKVDVAQQRWKSYINQLIAIVQLDPSPANQSMVYGAVSAYFSFLGTALLYSGTAEAVNMSLPVCKTKYTAEQRDSIISSDRNWRLSCPSWLNIEIDVEVAKIKADCSKYGVEVGAVIFAEYEHNFKTGSNTLAAGVGLKGKFLGGTAKAGIKQMVYVTFDNNNEFTDFGTRYKAEAGIADNPFNIGPVKIGGTLAGVEGVIQLGINSGFTSYVKGKGVLAEFVKIDKSL